MKINIKNSDYTFKNSGMGFNAYNFIRNISPRISEWLLNIYTNADIHDDKIVDKLIRIANIIDEE